MDIRHPQENIIKTYNYNGVAVDLVEWSNSVWCGKVGYADNPTEEPNVEKIMEGQIPMISAKFPLQNFYG